MNRKDAVDDTSSLLFPSAEMYDLTEAVIRL